MAIQLIIYSGNFKNRFHNALKRLVMANIMRLLFFLLCLVLSCGRFAMAGDRITKLARGVENVLTAPAEIPVRFIHYREEGYSLMMTGIAGTATGIGKTALRILGGLYEIITFPIPLPGSYAPLMTPATPFEALQAADALPEERSWV